LGDKKQSKLEKWRTKYASSVIALGCLYSLLVSWGEGWFFSVIMIFGIFICGSFAICDVKKQQKN
jgi:hypothetical protein